MRTIRVHVASSGDELSWADQFVAQRYLWRGYQTDKPTDVEGSGVKSKESVTLLASRDQETAVGTITVGVDRGGGLMLDEGNGHTVNLLRRLGRRVGEFIRLAVLDDVDSNRVLYHLFRTAYELLRNVYEATDILIEVNPRHVVFYERIFGFTVAAGERLCPRVGAPAVLLRLDLLGLDAQVAARSRPRAGRAEPIAKGMAVAT